MKKRLSICAPLVLIVLAGSLAVFTQATPAKILVMPGPEYPQAAKDAGVGGDVFVLVLIDKKGRAVVKDSFGPNAPCAFLDDPLTAAVREAAVDAAKKVTFEPATWKGKPVEKGVRLKYLFDPIRSQATGIDISASPEWKAGSVVNGRAINIPTPKYPGEASGRIAGTVDVSVVIFEDGQVHYASAISGHPIFRQAVVEAACKATFTPTFVSGRPVKSSGIILFEFYNAYK